MIGQTISHYRILEKLGEGGMGVVYKAEDIKLKRTVALKFLPPELTRDKSAKTRFIHEAQAASALQHHNICTIHEIDETKDGRLFIAMDCYEGETLNEKLARGALPIAEAVDIASQVAAGLSKAHEAGMVHRDIKPANVMVTKDGEVKILDFGLAKLAGMTKVTRTGTTVGTVIYMSPEQAAGHAIDHRSDIWSLGVVLYEMITGKLPFAGEHEAALLYQIVHSGFEPASHRVPEIPRALDTVIERALQKKPTNRYESPTEMIRDLDAIRIYLGSRGRKVRTRHWGDDVSKLLRRRPIVAALFCAIVITGALAVVFGRMGSRDRPSIAVIRIDDLQSRPEAASRVDEMLTASLDGFPGARILRAPRAREFLSHGSMDTIRTVGAARAVARRSGADLFIVPTLTEGQDSIEFFAHVYDTHTRQHILSVRTGSGKTAAAIDTLARRAARRLIAQSPAIRSLSRSSAARKLFERGDSLYLHGDFAAGIPLVERALKEDSTFIPAYHRLALWYRYENKRAQARACAQKAAALSRNDPVLSLRSEIIGDRVMGRPDLAETALRRYLQITPPNCAGLAEIAYVLYHDRRMFEAAVPYLKRSLEIDPEDLDGMRAKTLDGLGHAYLYLGRYDEAEGCFEHYIELEPENYDAIHSLATLNRMRGRYEAAREGFARVKKHNPTFFPAYDELALTYLAMGKCRMALQEIANYRRETQNLLHPNAFTLEGIVHFVQGEYEETLLSSRNAIESDSLWIPAQWLRGRTALELGRLPEARDALACIERRGAVTNAADDSAYVYNLRGWILIADGRILQGIRSLELAPGLSLQKAMEFRKDVVRGLLKGGRAAEAERRALEALSFNEFDAELLVLLGDICRRNDDERGSARYYDLARSVWKDADSDFAPLRRLNSRMTARTG